MLLTYLRLISTTHSCTRKHGTRSLISPRNWQPSAQSIQPTSPLPKTTAAMLCLSSWAPIGSKAGLHLQMRFLPSCPSGRVPASETPHPEWVVSALLKPVIWKSCTKTCLLAEAIQISSMVMVLLHQLLAMVVVHSNFLVKTVLESMAPCILKLCRLMR